MAAPMKKWKERFVLDAYDLAREGMCEKNIARALGVSQPTLSDWKTRYPLLGRALRRAYKSLSSVEDSEGDSISTFRGYVYNRLPQELQVLWDEINQIDKKKTGVEQIERLLSRRGTEARQHLFLYAWTASNFSTSQALRKVNISYSTFRKWGEDPTFSSLVTEIQWHKKNFFESSLINLVKSGDTGATIFANRTLNADRGYSEKVQVSHEHSGTITHAHIDIDELDLPVNIRRLILQAVRKKKVIESRVVDTGENAA